VAMTTTKTTTRKRLHVALFCSLELVLILWPIFYSTIPSCRAIRVKTKRKKPTTKTATEEDTRRRTPWTWNQTDTTVMSEVYTPASSSSDTTLYTMIQESIDTVYDSILDEIRPLKGFLDGVLSAASLCWTGYYQGFEGLVFEYPLKGYTTDGVLGLMGGTLVGGFHFGVMTVSGLAAGVYQLMRGAERTFAALRASKEGKVWDNLLKDWKFYSLEKEAGHVLVAKADLDNEGSFATTAPSPRRRLRKRVKDQSFYHLLQVPVDASPSEIKKAYYRRAMEVHPDKNSESEAALQFQTLSSVYKTLVSEETRELYDTHGVCFQDHIPDDDNAARVDPYTFFGILFGSNEVQPYVGSLAIASIVDNTLSLTKNAAPQQLSLDDSNYISPQQIRRQVQIAMHLYDRVKDFATGRGTTMTLADFTQSAKAEAQSLAMAMEGSIAYGFLLRAIGTGLILETKQELDPAWKRHLGGWIIDALESAKNIKALESLNNAIGHATMEAAKEAAQQQQRDRSDTDHVNDVKDDSACEKDQISADMDVLLMKLSVPRVFQLVWEFNVQDISRTVRASTRKVLDDCADDKELRRLKALALNALGHEFHLAVRSTRPNAKTKSNSSKIDKGAAEHPDSQTLRETVQAALMDSIIQNVPHPLDEWDYE
jgi:hypothetical protein